MKRCIFFLIETMCPNQYSYAELCFHVVDCCCDKNGSIFLMQFVFYARNALNHLIMVRITLVGLNEEILY